jgi:hypothetical protein
VAGTILRKVLTKLALGNLISRDKAFLLTQITLEQNKYMQSGPWAPLPLLAGVLQASPPRNESLLLGSPFPAMIRSHGNTSLRGHEISSTRDGIETRPP